MFCGFDSHRGYIQHQLGEMIMAGERANFRTTYYIETVAGVKVPRKDGALYNILPEEVPQRIKKLAEDTADVGDFALVEIVATEMGGDRSFRYTHRGETGFVSGQY